MRVMSLLSRLFPRRAELSAPPAQATPDPWFWSHYNDAASIVLDLVPPHCVGIGSQAIDFGCGDGATALGVASRAEARVTGVDLYKTFAHLPDLAQRSLGKPELPANLAFTQNELGKPLPLPDRFADLIYSWSVFEHVADPEGIMAELARVAKPGATLLIQIEPLFYSPFGSHLRRLVDEPWAHLLHDEEDYVRKAAEATDHIGEGEKDVLYRTTEFEKLKSYLVAEYRALNRITAEELLRIVTLSGFEIRSSRHIRVEGLEPPAQLLRRYSRDQLLTNQIVVIAERKG
jgi:SAM-dependent methyltransferase